MELFIGLLVVLIVLIVVVYGSNHEDEKKAKMINEYMEAVIEQTQTLIAPHIKTLCIKFDQTVYQDEYGNHVFTLWNTAKDYFIDNVLRKDSLIISHLDVSLPNDQIGERLERSLRRINIGTMIDDAIFAHKKLTSSNDCLSVDVDVLGPIEFERHCSDMLKSSGWESRTTKGSGDQGIDIIATYKGTKAVFQCKKYSHPVGNSAVQEIIAGKVFEQAHVAVVVSNSSYTLSAKQLASTTGVHLLHYSELREFAERLGLAGG